MAFKEAARGSCSYARAKNSVAETRSIVSNAGLFRTSALSTLFMLALLAVPTAMAALRQLGWW